MRSPNPASRLLGVCLAALLLIGLFLRFLHTFDMQASPIFDRPVMDPGYHDEWARSIVRGEPITDGEPFFRAPAYPYFLAAVYAIGGGDPRHPRYVQAVLGVLSLYLAYRIGRKVFGKGTALLALSLALLYPILLFFDGELKIEPFAVFLNLILLTLLLEAEERRSLRLWFAAGLLLGLSAAARPNILLFAPAIPLWLLLHRRENLLASVAAPSLLAALGAVLVLAPITVRNLREGNDRVWIASQGGINFYLGNHPGADGWSATAPGIRKDWKGGIEDSRLLAARALGRKAKDSEVSAYWYERGKAFIRENPREAALLFLKKSYLLFHGAELSNNYIIDFAARYSRPFRALPLCYGLIMPLAIVGMVFARWDRRKLLLLFFLAAYSLSIVLFFVCSRYRMPLLPVLLLFAASGLLRLGAGLRRRRARVLPGAALLLLLVFLLNHDFGAVGPIDWSLGYQGEGVSLLERGDAAGAAERFREATRLRPGSSDLHHDLGVALRALEDREGAIASFRRSIELSPSNPEAHNNLALTLAAEGRAREAEETYRRGIAIDPRHPGLRVNVAQLLQGEGRYEEAAEEYRAFLRSGIRDGRVHANLGFCLVRMGRAAEGEEELRAGVRISPEMPGPVLLLAEHLAASGREEEARAALRGAAARLPEEPSLAEALLALDKPSAP
ncbi:MAG: glycosyltransferase family 39 protein [Candidatus Eisenbacteria bacterium]|nr:glycosyltransferase family 39 protein [Candidatus Eisenbacteria bacterium]